MKRLLTVSILCLTAALLASCNMRFLRLGGSPPPGPPAWERKALPAECLGPGCPQNGGVAAKGAGGPRLAERGMGKGPIGPRLSALLARDELEKLVAGRVVLDAPERIKSGATARIEA